MIVGDTAKALAMSPALFEKGVYVSGFGFPVVPQGHARLRCQISAVHSTADLRRPSTRSWPWGRSSARYSSSLRHDPPDVEVDLHRRVVEITAGSGSKGRGRP